MSRTATSPSSGAAPERFETARGAAAAPSERAGRPSGNGDRAPCSAARDDPSWTAPRAIDEFTAAWERGESPRAEEYLPRLRADARSEAVELIYREYCLAEAEGLAPDAAAYLGRFPLQREALERLLRFHSACTVSLLGRLAPETPEDAGAGIDATMPEAGDSIGPYVLRRELGRGGFARVFLAEQADLENRLVVVKLSTRATREPWLLARARHPHIVEIVSHSLVDDGAFQLICMPFFGGATLDAVLTARRERDRERLRRRGRDRDRDQARRRFRWARPAHGFTPMSGAGLLDDLDRTAAPEYLGATSSRPARELIARLSYDRAAAWIVARLGEALDHAFRQGVSHGDVKPSNVLLAADGKPMLLDFNLARGGADGPHAGGDPGGTLAYMPPERLRALGALGAGQLPLEHDRDDDNAPHLADIYALGMVLLELLTGRPPLIVKTSQTGAGGDTGRAPDDVPGAKMGPTSSIVQRPAFQSAAVIYARTRERSARAIVDRAAAAIGRSIAPGLRSILERCLDPSPARRYGRAFELAEDLDRWRCGRPLAFADEPFWRQRVPRWAWRQRRALAVAVVSIAAIGSVVLAVQRHGTELLALKNQARGKLARIWDRDRSHSYRELPARTLHLLRPDEPWVIDAARQALEEYGILGPGEQLGDAARRWSERDDVRRLDDDDRQDLELWLIERAYRYCRAHDERTRSPDDWALALTVLDATTRGRAFAALQPLRQRLAARLQNENAGQVENPGGRLDDRLDANPNSNASGPANVSSAGPAPAWLEEHLLGFVAECEEPHGPSATAIGDGAGVERERAGALSSGGGALVAASRLLVAETVRQNRAAARALRHYRKSLALRPGSYWGHYRAAGISYGLGLVADAAGHLQHCLERRPGGVLIPGMLAGCLVELEHYPEALALCDQAIDQAPDHAEFYRTRAFVRRELGQAEGLREDLRRLDVHWRTGELPGSPRQRPQWGPFAELPVVFGTVAPPAPTVLEDRSLSGLRDQGTPDASRIAGRRSIEARLQLVDALRSAGDPERAEALLDQVVRERPGDVAARLKRVAHAIEDRRFEAARRDFEAVRDRADLTGVLRDTIANRFTPFFLVTHEYLKAGLPSDAERIARFTLGLAIQIGQDVAKSRYSLAQVHAFQARLGSPHALQDAAEQLQRAFADSPFLKRWYREDRWWIYPVRPRIDAILRALPPPSTNAAPRR